MDQAHIRQAIARVETLSPLPGSAARLLGEEAQTTHELASWAQADPVLAFHVLAHCASRGAVQESGDIGGAVRQLGAAGVRRSALRSLFNVSGHSVGLDAPPHMRRFWRHAVLTAHIARELARATARAAPEQAYTAGLLHDFGKWVLCHVFPDRVSTWTFVAVDGGVKGLEAEHEALEVDHSLAGKWALESAGLPENLARVAWLHHIPAALLDDRPQTLPLLELTQVANRLARRTEAEDGEIAAGDLAPDEAPEHWRLMPEIVVNACQQAHVWCSEWEPKIFAWTGPESVGRATVTNAVLSVLDQSVQMEAELASVRRRLERSEALLELHQALRDATETGAVLAATAEAVRRAIGISPGIVLAHDPGSGRLTGEAWKNQEEPTQGFTIERNGRPGRGQAALSERQLGALRSLARRDNNAPDSNSIASELQRQRGLIAAPMTWAGCVRGRIMFESENGSPPLAESDYMLLLRMAGVAGWALAHCQRRTASDRDAERLAAIGMLGKGESSSQRSRSKEMAAPEDRIIAVDFAAAIEDNLANITTHAAELLDQGLDPDAASPAQRILKECQQAGAVLSDAHAIYSRESERARPLALNQAIRAALDEMGSMLDTLGVFVETQFEGRAPYVRGDHQRLVRGFSAWLAYLAEQAGSEGGLVAVRTEMSKDRDAVWLHVEWRGLAIAFNEFEQLTRIDKAPHQHWRQALPLAAWRTEVECLGGAFALTAPSETVQRIEIAYPIVEARPGEDNSNESAVPMVEQPRREDGPGHASAKALAEWPGLETEDALGADCETAEREPSKDGASAAGWSGAEETGDGAEAAADGDATSAVLIIEEDAVLREVLTETLRSRGYRVEIADDQAAARKVLAERTNDLVLWGLDGAEDPRVAAESFVASVSHASVIVMKHDLSEDVEERILAAGVRACLKKPFHVDELLSAVAQAAEAFPGM